MYGYEWSKKYGVYRLIPNAKIIKEIRPVFKEELDYFGFDKHWKYPKTDVPILWAEGIRRYNVNGVCVAEAVGGGFYTKPVIKLKDGYEKLKLKAVNIDTLWKENEKYMLGLEKTALDFIRRVHDEYEKQGLQFVVAFSGGKDSLVLLDLVAKALRPDEFFVIFSNTGMELSATLEAIERSKKHWDKLRFYEAESHMTPDETWEAFGPPGRRLRWCCAVHKSVPTILKLRKITGDYEAKAVVFEGVRREESSIRETYEHIRDGVKNISQVNISPILEWGSAEVYLYLLKKGIFFNDAYRFGLNRVGCTVCPMSSGWRDSLSNEIYPDDIYPLLLKVEDYVECVKPAKNKQKYIENGGWRARMGGNRLPQAAQRVIEQIENDCIAFQFTEKTKEWLDVCKVLGNIVSDEDGVYTQLINYQSYTFTLNAEIVSYSPYSLMDRFIISHLRGIANKVAYCVGCKACEVQCPVDAFIITDMGNILIREENCTHCGNCLEFEAKSCIVANSLKTGRGTIMILKGMDRYKTFGFRREWLELFFECGIECFSTTQLGNRQYDALRVWLREAGLLAAPNKGEKSGTTTQLYDILKTFRAGNPLVWAFIWTNLAYTSVITRWFMLSSRVGETYNSGELVFMLGDDYSPSTRQNAVSSLLETLRHSPVGAVLKQGIPIPDGKSHKYLKQGWDSPEAVAILYAMYKYAEETGRYTTTITALEAARGNPEAKGVDPVSIFGLNPANFKQILQDVAIAFPNYLRVVFQQDLDNIVLVPEKTSLDIVKIIVD
jgi:phosphoadenosine phosphosulfate reductase